MQNFDNFSMERDKIRKRGRTNLRVIIFVLAVVILGGALIRNETQETERKVALDGEVLLNGDISFEEADAKLREAGFVPVESDVSPEDAQVQRYEGRKVYGHKADISLLGYTALGKKSNMLAIIHCFTEDPLTNTENPGKSFTDVREKLTQSLGKEPTEEEGFLYWELKGRSTVIMGYMQNGLWELMYSYTK